MLCKVIAKKCCAERSLCPKAPYLRTRSASGADITNVCNQPLKTDIEVAPEIQRHAAMKEGKAAMSGATGAFFKI
jgi:hypothetical protein